MARFQMPYYPGPGFVGAEVVPQPKTPCASQNNKLAVQMILADLGYFKGVQNGIWGPDSQAALEASRQGYQELAVGCTPPVPPVVSPPPSSVSPWVMAGVAAAGFGLGLVTSSIWQTAEAKRSVHR